MTDITHLVNSTWTSIQPLLPIIAAKGAEEVGKLAVSEIWDLVKKKFAEKPETQKKVEKLLSDPENTDRQAAFRVALEEILEDDPAFGAELQKLLPAASGESYNATLTRDGAIAQGQNARAVGAGGIMVGGNVSGGIHPAAKKDKK